MFIRLLTSIISASNHTKCVSLSNQRCMTQPTIISLHANEYTQGLRHYKPVPGKNFEAGVEKGIIFVEKI